MLFRSKDQSYVLAVLNREQLRGAHFPLGDTKKEDVRLEAQERGLSVAKKPDSHDICFVPSGDNAGWLRERLGSEVGSIVDESGAKIGEHKGAYTYTVGQRRGLGLTIPDPSGEPRYVLRIEPVSNTVVVGTKDSLAITQIIGEKPIWCGPVSETHSTSPARGLVQVRAHGSAYPCSYYREIDGEIEKLVITTDEPIFGLATGQGAVVYDGQRVVGSATIAQTL